MNRREFINLAGALVIALAVAGADTLKTRMNKGLPQNTERMAGLSLRVG